VSLLKETFPAKDQADNATTLALELSAGQDWRISFLQQLIAPDANVKVDPARIYRALLDASQEKVQKSEGSLHEIALQEQQRIELQWLQYLLKTKQYDRLRDELAGLPENVRKNEQSQIVPLQLQLAAITSGLDSILDGYRNDPEHAPAAEVLRRAATELRAAGDKQSARKVLEFVFTREIENHNLTAANLMGLAEIRIESGDLSGGVSLLKRMTLVAGNPFESQDPAAALLMRMGHPAEAVPFLADLVQAVPWNGDYRLRLAQAQLAANQVTDAARKELRDVASASGVAYETRVNAACALTGAGGANLGSRELNLIAGPGDINPTDANQPFFFAARLKAAEAMPAKARIALLRAALEDNPNGDAVRVPLLKAAFESGDYSLVVAAVKPQLQSSALESPYARRQAQDQDEEEPLEEAPAANTAIPGFGDLPPKEWAEISRDLGTAFAKINDLDQALVYLHRAYRLETDAGVKSQVNKEVQQIRATQRRRAANLMRQPQIHSAIEQEHVVRPRLAAASIKPAAPSQKGATQ
jgi:hypothetical protein